MHSAASGSECPRERLADPTPSAWQRNLYRYWRLRSHCCSTPITRQPEDITITTKLADYSGGAHYDLLKASNYGRNDRYEVVAELSSQVRADIRDGLYFELLSMGESVARSPDIHVLFERMRHDL
jgi:hypothetical protein